MKAKIQELEALLKKAQELAGEIAVEASDKAYLAKSTYRSLRNTGRDDEEDAAFEEYSNLRLVKTSAESLENSLKGHLECYTSLFQIIK